MSAHEGAIEQHHGGSTKLFAMVWVYLLLLTGIEIFLAYERLAVVLMLVILIGLSLVKSALIVAYFMHLRFERLGVFSAAGPGHGFLHLHDADLVLPRQPPPDGIAPSLSTGNFHFRHFTALTVRRDHLSRVPTLAGFREGWPQASRDCNLPTPHPGFDIRPSDPGKWWKKSPDAPVQDV